MAPTLSPTTAPTLPAHYEEVTSGNCISTGRLVPTEAECELVAQKMGLSDQDVSGYAGTAIASGCVFYKRSSLYMNHKQWTGNQPCSTTSPCLCRTADWTAAAYVMTTVPSSCTEPIANADECEAASAIVPQIGVHYADAFHYAGSQYLYLDILGSGEYDFTRLL